MTVAPSLLGLLGLVPAAHAVDGEVAIRIGGRTEPEAALEQPAEWEPAEEFEPAALTILSARVGHQDGDGPWWRVSGAAWGVAPEGESSLLSLTPQAGVSSLAGPWRLDVAGRTDLQAYVVEEGDASSVRGEVFASITRPSDRWIPRLSVVGIARQYPIQPTWSFRSVEPAVELTYRRDDGWVRWTGSGQANHHQDVLGTQVRTGVTMGLTGAKAELWGGYGLIAAQGGGTQAAARPPFTPLGDYAADADALSAGGFLQHRVDIGTSMFLGDWTVRASGLARLRQSVQLDPATFDRTGHGQLDVERPFGGPWTGVATVGVSGARLVGGGSYTDVYGWLGVRWTPRKADDEG